MCCFQIFKGFWAQILNGKPIHLSQIEQAVQDMVDLCTAQMNKLKHSRLSKEEKIMLMMNNKDRDADTEEEVLRSKQNLANLVLGFLEAVKSTLGSQEIAGVVIDNKLGAQVRKRVDTEYIKAFNQINAQQYAELKKDGTFGTKYTFSWAIPLGLSDDYEVQGDAAGRTTAVWKKVHLLERQVRRMPTGASSSVSSHGFPPFLL